MFSKGNNRSLINAGTLVGTLELQQLVVVYAVILVPANPDGLRIHEFNRSGVFSQNNCAGVASGLVLDTGSDIRSLSHKQRNRLTLHVTTHQGTVRIVVFQERNHCSGYGHYLLR